MDTDLKELIEVDGMMEAEIIKAKLESEGIPAILRFESAGRLFGITMDGLGKVKIFVPDEFYSQAKSLIESQPAEK